MDLQDAQSRSGAFIRAIAILLLLGGATVCIAWIADHPELTQVMAASSMVVFNTGLLFIVSGIGLLACFHSRPRIGLFSATAILLLAGLTLAEYFTGIDLGIDFAPAPLAGSDPHPGRMAPNTATAFVLAGGALLLLASSKAAWKPAVVAMLGTLVVAVSAIALLGYAIDLRATYEWTGFKQMALVTATGFAPLGAALVGAAIRLGGARAWHELPWAAASVGIGLAALSVLAWIAFRTSLGPTSAWPDAILLLALCISALLAGLIAQARHLRLQTVALAEANGALQRSAAEIRDLYDRAPCGYHSLDRSGRIIEMNRTELDWLGYARDDLVGKVRMRDLMTPQSIHLYEINFPRFVATGELKDLQLELTRRDGTVLPVMVSATALRDSHGDFTMSRTTVYDMTERRRIEAALAESEQRLLALLENLQAAVVVHGPDTRIQFANPAAATLLGLTLDQLLGRVAMDPHWHFVREDGSAMPLDEFPVNVVLRTRAVLRDYVVGFRLSPDTEPRWALVSGIPEYSSSGEIQRVVISFVDLTDRRRMEHELAQQARTDPLTRLANRRHFMEVAGREVSRSRRHLHPLAVLLLDIDHFKSINDEYGHACGDLVLQQFATTLGSVLRDADFAGRIGGEEFCVLMPEADTATAGAAAERLRKAIATAVVVPPQGGVLHITASIGVAGLEPGDADFAAILTRADEAMYLAKRGGRNQVRCLPVRRPH